MKLHGDFSVENSCGICLIDSRYKLNLSANFVNCGAVLGPVLKDGKPEKNLDQGIKIYKKKSRFYAAHIKRCDTIFIYYVYTYSVYLKNF